MNAKIRPSMLKPLAFWCTALLLSISACTSEDSEPIGSGSEATFENEEILASSSGKGDASVRDISIAESDNGYLVTIAGGEGSAAAILWEMINHPQFRNGITKTTFNEGETILVKYSFEYELENPPVSGNERCLCAHSTANQRYACQWEVDDYELYQPDGQSAANAYVEFTGGPTIFLDEVMVLLLSGSSSDLMTTLEDGSEHLWIGPFETYLQDTLAVKARIYYAGVDQIKPSKNIFLDAPFWKKLDEASDASDLGTLRYNLHLTGGLKKTVESLLASSAEIYDGARSWESKLQDTFGDSSSSLHIQWPYDYASSEDHFRVESDQASEEDLEVVDGEAPRKRVIFEGWIEADSPQDLASYLFIGLRQATGASSDGLSGEAYASDDGSVFCSSPPSSGRIVCEFRAPE